VTNLGHLLSLIAHEVRAPLGVVRGYLLLLDQGADLPESHRTAVAASLRATDRAAELLNQLSALARLHRGEVVLSLQHLPLQPLLQSAIETLALPKDPVVTLHVGDTPDVSVMADGPLMRTAIAGLASAVVRAQAADTRVYLLTREEPYHGERGVTLTITAMEALTASHTDRPLDLMRGGLGLELPIAEFIIDAHRGHVLERRDDKRFVGVVVWLPIV
jgi:signal transduction histidine kinase